MSTEIKTRRGTLLEHQSFTGAVGEITVDTTLDSLRVHDGVKAGGHSATLQAIALSLNTDKDNVIFSTDTTTAIPEFIHNTVNQQTYAVPSGAQGGMILSVVGDALLVQGGGTYIMLLSSDVVSAGSTTPRALAERFADVVNIKDFENLVSAGNWTPAFDAAYALHERVVVYSDVLLATPLSIPDGSTLSIRKSATVLKDPSLLNQSFIILGDNCLVDGFGTIDGNFRNMDQGSNDETIGNSVRVGENCVINDVTISDAESSHIASSGLNAPAYAQGLRVNNVAFGDFIDHCVYTSGVSDNIDVQARSVICTTANNGREAFKCRGQVGNVIWRDCPNVIITGTRGNLFVVEVDDLGGANRSYGVVTVRGFNNVESLYLGQCVAKDGTTELGDLVVDDVNFKGTATLQSEYRAPVRTSGGVHGAKSYKIKNCKLHNVLPMSLYQKDSFTAEPEYNVEVIDNRFTSDIVLPDSLVSISTVGGSVINYTYKDNRCDSNHRVVFSPGTNTGLLDISSSQVSRNSELVKPLRAVAKVRVKDNVDLRQADRACLDVSSIAGSYVLEYAEITGNIFNQLPVSTTIGVLSGTVTYLNNNTEKNSFIYPTGTLRSTGTTSERPVFASGGGMNGYQYFDSTLARPIWYSNAAWVFSDGTPA